MLTELHPQLPLMKSLREFKHSEGRRHMDNHAYHWAAILGREAFEIKG